VSAHQAEFGVAKQCEVLGVSRSGYYDWKDRPLSRRAREDVVLAQKIRLIHVVSRGTYGAPRVHAELGADGVHVGKKRVARLMRALGLQGATRRRFTTTTVRDKDARPAPDLVERDFKAESRDRLWVADITYVPTAPGFLFLAVVLDAWSRKVVGWCIANHLRAEIVVEALEMACAQRRPADVIHHSDQGTQYTSIAFGLRCRAARVRPSMGSVGDAYDNAMAESFFASLETELLARHGLRGKAETRMALFEWIEGWYNPRRRHSALGYLSPNDFEARATEALTTAST
jgi:putative transposase